MKRLHLCYLGNASSIHLVRWYEYFRQHGHRISVISFDQPLPELASVTLQLTSFTKTSLKYFTVTKQLKQYLQQLNPDILQVIYIGGYGTLATRAQFHPLILASLGSDVLIPHSKLLRQPLQYLLKRSLRSADLIHCQAKILQKEIKQYKPTAKIITSCYGIDIKNLPQHKDTTIIKPLCVISTRYFEPLYNLKLLARAIPLVLKQNKRIQFNLIGGGPQKQQLIDSLTDQIQSGLVQISDKLDHQDLLQCLSRSDIYVSTSKSDGASQSLLEAMAIGLFPIVTDIPANQEWISNGLNGFLCSVNDPQSLASAILRASNDPTLRQQARDLNLAIIKERADYSKNMSQIEQELYRLLAT